MVAPKGSIYSSTALASRQREVKDVADRQVVYITENGLSCTDSIHLDGKVHDPARIDFTHRYLLALRRAIDSGVDVRGYFHWSLLDNFEWSEGYNERFGLIYLDYATGKRTPKDSAAWYAKVAETNGKNL